MEWLRLWHDMPNDPKWRTIAKKSGHSISTVIAVYLHMLVIASKNNPRGQLSGWSDEDIASALDIEPEDIKAIREVMQGRVLEGDLLTGWANRQSQNQESTDSNGVYVYVLVATRSKSYKIGVSRNPWARARDLQTGSAEPVELFAKFKGVRSNEAEVHDALRHFRTKGEWFDLPDFVVKKIETYAKQQVTAGQLRELLSVDVEAVRSEPVAPRSYEDTDKDTDTDTEDKTTPSGSDDPAMRQTGDLLRETQEPPPKKPTKGYELTKVKGQYQYPEEFNRLWEKYPKRPAGDDKREAFNAFNARIKGGATLEEIEAGLDRYIAYLIAKDNLGTDYIKRGSTFFGPAKWYEQPWSPGRMPVNGSNCHALAQSVREQRDAEIDRLMAEQGIGVGVTYEHN